MALTPVTLGSLHEPTGIGQYYKPPSVTYTNFFGHTKQTTIGGIIDLQLGVET